jgi:hypothetical protein
MNRRNDNGPFTGSSGYWGACRRLGSRLGGGGSAFDLNLDRIALASDAAFAIAKLGIAGE